MKKYLPHLIALAAFLVLTFAYFAPLFSGKELKQTDINNWKGMSQEIIEFKEKTGEQTLWTNSMFGGMPAYQISVVYSANLLRYIDTIVTFGLPTPAKYVFLFMIGFYFLLITMKVDSRLSILGAIAFAFSSYFLIVIEAGHNSKAHAIGYMAPIIAGILITYQGRLLLGAAITGLALGLQLYANHLQITYYTMMMAVLLVITLLYSAVKEKRISDFAKASGLLIVAAVLAFAANITNLLATQEYGKYSTRGPSDLTANKENQTSGLDRDYITDWSYGIGESLTLLVPDFKGGASEAISENHKDALNKVDPNFRQYVSGFSSYFGDQPFVSGPTYAGAIIILLFVIGLFIVRGPVKWWLLSATVLSLLLSWGRNFMGFTNFFLDNLPGYDKFRAVAMILVIAEFTLPLLAVLAIDQLLRENEAFKAYGKKVIIAISIVAGLTLLIAVSPGTFTTFYTPNEYDRVAEQLKGQQGGSQMLDQFFDAVTQARQEIVTSDAMRSFGFILIASILIYTYIRFRYNKQILVFGLILLVTMDLLSVDRRYLSSDDFVRVGKNSAPFAMTQADQMIKQDTSTYRVLNLTVSTFNDASTSYYHQSIGGYHGAKLKRYKELIDYRLTKEIAAITTAMQSRDTAMQQTMNSQPTLNMLNAKYVIYNPEAPPFMNSGALGNAWFVGDLQFVPNADAEIAALDKLDTRTSAVADEKYKSIAGTANPVDSASTIRLVSYRPNHLTYSTNTNSEQIAVFSEIYYDKGWNVYVDGKKADYFRVNYVLRAMRVPQGKHTIEWKFEPEVYAKGEKISFAGSLLLILMCAGTAFIEYRKSKQQA